MGEIDGEGVVLGEVEKGSLTQTGGFGVERGVSTGVGDGDLGGTKGVPIGVFDVGGLEFAVDEDGRRGRGAMVAALGLLPGGIEVAEKVPGDGFSLGVGGKSALGDETVQGANAEVGLGKIGRGEVDGGSVGVLDAG